MKHMIFSATAGKEKIQYCIKLQRLNQIVFKENNKESLHKVYNKAIDFAIQENVEN
jgi:hypothetical protein